MAGILIKLTIGLPLMIFWYAINLAHVTYHEYAVIIMPIQAVIGIVVSSIF